MIDFDEAILSRIHLSIKYHGLAAEFRREIWTNLLYKAHMAQVLLLLDKFSLNGRDIKNLISIAHALATVEVEPVTYASWCACVSDCQAKIRGVLHRCTTDDAD